MHCTGLMCLSFIENFIRRSYIIDVDGQGKESEGEREGERQKEREREIETERVRERERERERETPNQRKWSHTSSLLPFLIFGFGASDAKRQILIYWKAERFVVVNRLSDDAK